MNLTIRRPFHTTIAPIDQIVDQLMGSPFFGFNGAGPSASIEEGNLALDISETPTQVIVRASVPGFSKEQIDVEVHDGVLTIKAEKSETTEEKGETFYRRERRTGSLSRRVALPSVQFEGDPKAELKDGVLTLALPKSAKATPQKVRIN
jgi:HSP20 family protein